MSTSQGETIDILTLLERGHRMGCSDPNDPSRHTMYGDAAAEIRMLRTTQSDVYDLIATALGATVSAGMDPDCPEDFQPRMLEATNSIHAAMVLIRPATPLSTELSEG